MYLLNVLRSLLEDNVYSKFHSIFHLGYLQWNNFTISRTLHKIYLCLDLIKLFRVIVLSSRSCFPRRSKCESKCVGRIYSFYSIMTHIQTGSEGRVTILPRLSCQFPMENNCLICTTCTQTTKLVL